MTYFCVEWDVKPDTDLSQFCCLFENDIIRFINIETQVLQFCKLDCLTDEARFTKYVVSSPTFMSASHWA